LTGGKQCIVCLTLRVDVTLATFTECKIVLTLEGGCLEHAATAVSSDPQCAIGWNLLHVEGVALVCGGKACETYRAIPGPIRLTCFSDIWQRSIGIRTRIESGTLRAVVLYAVATC